MKELDECYKGEAPVGSEIEAELLYEIELLDRTTYFVGFADDNSMTNHYDMQIHYQDVMNYIKYNGYDKLKILQKIKKNLETHIESKKQESIKYNLKWQE